MADSKSRAESPAKGASGDKPARGARRGRGRPRGAKAKARQGGGGQGGSEGPGAERVELVLSSRRATWAIDPDEQQQSEAELTRQRPRIFKRDRTACCACGFRSGKYQEIHHLNDDHTDHRPANLAAICPFCHGYFHIGRAGLTGEAELIWLPELPAWQLSHLARAIFVGMHLDSEMRPAAENLYSALRVRADDARRRLGTSDPADLGEALLALEDEAYERRADMLDGVRLLPLGRKYAGDEDIFPAMLDYYVSNKGPFGRLPPESWPELHDKVARAVGL